MASTTPPPPPPPPPTPEQWPTEVVDQYEPVRNLGKGGFASVMLAKKKQKKDDDDNNNNDNNNTLVAMKVVGTSGDFSKQEHGYARREIDILQEISHPNIMKCLQYWRIPSTSLIVMALSYSNGPTLEQLIQYGGAIGITFGRVVMTQLIDAIAYCHSRGVIHRDIKPDNIIVTGASPSNEELWIDTTQKQQKQTGDDDDDNKDWKTLYSKWHVTLIDFGFARALTPDDIEKENVAVKRLSIQQQQTSSSMHSGKFSVESGASGHSLRDRRKSRRSLDKSVSHAMKRTMSAVGNRLYAAPEIVQGVHSRHSILGGSGGNNSSNPNSLHGSTHHPFDITQTLSEHVANYGVLADAYSLGNTLQYMMTGVPPNQNVTEVVANHNSPLAVLFRWICKHACGGGDNQQGQRDYRYRSWSALPKEATQLIRSLNHPSVSQRISVRAIRRYPYIETVLLAKDDNAEGEESGEDDEWAHHRIHFLKCALKQEEEEEQQQQQQQQKTATSSDEVPTTISAAEDQQQETAPPPCEDEAAAATSTTKESDQVVVKGEDSANRVDMDPVPPQEAAVEDATAEEDVGLPI